MRLLPYTIAVAFAGMVLGIGLSELGWCMMRKKYLQSLAFRFGISGQLIAGVATLSAIFSLLIIAVKLLKIVAPLVLGFWSSM